MTVEIHKRVYDQKLLGSLNLDNEILERIFLSRGITRAEDLNKSIVWPLAVSPDVVV